MSFKKKGILLMLTFLSGCTIVIGADNGVSGVGFDKVNPNRNEELSSYSVECSGGDDEWYSCLSKAGNICKVKGFYIHSVNGEPYTVSLERTTE
jgi:hypothetical protein